MQFLRENLKTIVIILILLIGLIVGLVLVQKQQLFKSRAASGLDSLIKVTPLEEEQNNVTFDQETNTFTTSSNNVKIQLNPEALEALKEEAPK